MNTPLRPVPITTRLQMLGERLRDACAARNWTALARTDAELAQLLGGLDAGALSPGERGALRQLRRLHQQVSAECQRELERIGQTLQQMRQQRQGWSAYAEAADWGVEAQA
jgi:50S ribosomal subunit-associated GTPase HflX